MSTNSGKPRRQIKSQNKKRNSPLRQKEKVRTLETAIDEVPGFTDITPEQDQETQSDSLMPESEPSKSSKSRGIRLQKLLADRGYGSRRKMESWITEGKVEVNGQTAQLGQRVVVRDIIKVKGYALREKPKLASTKVLMYNKSEGEICTMNDPKRRPTVFRNLPKIRGARWVTVGRLDINTAGLLLFTTNGELANKLMHPSSGIEREYRCRIFGQIDRAIVKQLLSGIEIENHTMKFNNIRVEDFEGDKRNKWVHVTLEEGRNREVRKLWEAVGCQVSRLTRVRYGFLSLPRNLRQGQYRELTSKEVRRLLT
jgi:23S rRNA pseudouridine2605 synthase